MFRGDDSRDVLKIRYGKRRVLVTRYVRRIFYSRGLSAVNTGLRAKIADGKLHMHLHLNKWLLYSYDSSNCRLQAGGFLP